VQCDPTKISGYNPYGICLHEESEKKYHNNNNNNNNKVETVYNYIYNNSRDTMESTPELAI
jgi:hypothetical protein